MKNQFHIPGAILLGCIIIAAALFLGLKSENTDRSPDEDVSDINSSERNVGKSGAGAPVAEQAPGSAPDEPEPEVLPQAKVDSLAKEALEKTRQLMLERCWEPAIKENPEPKTSEFIYDMTFDGRTGKAISRGVNEIREKSRTDVGVCLRELPMDYVIEPPGKNTRVEFSFTLP